MTTYKELIFWKKSIDLVVLIYKLTSTFPPEEKYGLTTQLRRAVISIPSNISEGWTRKNSGEYVNFLSIANGSAAEVETQLILSDKLDFGDKDLRLKCLNLLTEIQKMLSSAVVTMKSR